MSKEEIKYKLDRINMDIFFLEMKDHWDNADHDYFNELTSEKKQLENQLKEC